MSQKADRNSCDSFEERIKKSLKVDARYSVLDFKSADDYLYIYLDSISSAMYTSQMYQEIPPRFRIKIVLLPDKSVGDLTKGICHVAVAPVRRSAASSSEQVTQILYGETFETLQLVNGWVRVRLHADGYVGWISSDQTTLMEDNQFYDFQFLPKVYAAQNVLRILDKPSENVHAIREAVYGSPLRITGRHGRYLSVKLPDGPVGWIEKSSTKQSIRPETLSVKQLVDTARKFLGVSYIWGGRSPKGFDCSGFVQTVYKLNGVSLPRDTDMQFLAGEKLGRDLRKLRTGDLLFFSSNGHKINHVAIFTGKNKEFIHSSGFVRINSFDRNRKNFSENLLSTFVGACRVI